jgi:hypothetical protein
MFEVNVEMYGLPHNITQQNKIAVKLKDEASLKDIVAALKQKIPELEGQVIQRGQDQLIENYSFIVNGQFQPFDSGHRIQQNDRIVLVLLATGG